MKSIQWDGATFKFALHAHIDPVAVRPNFISLVMINISEDLCQMFYSLLQSARQ